MTMQARGDLNISGAGRSSGGLYNQVRISGSGKVTGDLDAQSVQVSGAAKLEGNVKAQVVKCSGACKIAGNVEATEFRCSGAAKVAGSLHADDVSTSGAVTVGGGVSGKNVTLSGVARFGGEVAVEQFRSSGVFSVDGLLSADRVEVALGGGSRAREIGGEEIRILSGGGDSLFGWRHRNPSGFETDTIEGDDIYLEATRATAVRGRRVVIGPGCTIGEVEYSESLQLDPQASVERPTYTGAEPAPPVNTAAAERPEGWAREHAGGACCGNWSMNLGGRQISHAGGRLLAAAFGLLVAAVVISVVVFVVLPAVGVLVTAVLGLVGTLLLVVLVALPLIILGAVIAEALRRGPRRG